MLYRMILFVRHLRSRVVFSTSIRFLVVALMLAGMWVATQALNVSSDYEPNDKLMHFVVFFGFSVLVDLSSARKPFWLWKGLPLLVYGMIIEIMQYFSLERSFSLFDWYADFIGVFLYFLLKKTIIKIV
jgi:VanZ family protein